MKKVLLTVAALLALSMAFVGCNNNTKDESGATLSIAKNYEWTKEGTKDASTFANWQTIVDLNSSWKLAAGDEVTVTFSGKSSKAFKVAKANIVDNTEAANWWTELASVESKDVVFAGSAADDAVATDTFTEVKSTYKIDTAATAAGAAKLVIYIEPESLGYADKSDAYTNGPETIDFTDVTIKVDLNGGSSDSETPSEDSETPTTNELVIWENKTLTAKSATDITDWAAGGSYATDFVAVNWDNTYSGSDYSAVTVEYEKPEGWKGGYLIINSAEGGTGWTDKSEWSYSGKLSIDIPDGKDFSWICVRMYVESAKTDVNLTIKKLSLTKK